MMATPDPSIELMRLINGYQVSQALHVVASLGIADQLRNGPKSSDAMAKACEVHPGSLYRLLRALAAVGVFHENDDKEFSLTPVGACLSSDAVASRRNWARYIGRSGHWQVWGNLLHSIKTGEGAYQATHGMDSWSYRKSVAEEQASFDAAMTANSGSQARAVLQAYDFSKFACIVDVGGGQGLLLKEILLACPSALGVLFDQPQVVASAGEVLTSPDLAQRCSIVAGSFLESVPEGGDAYVMKFILHDWDDQHAIDILRACRRAMPPRATLIVIERVVGPLNEVPEGKFSDLNMLVSHGALERTREEFTDLFRKGGFELSAIVETPSPLSIIVGKPVAAP
jgi:O-methyltransferase/methyltransferase family protein